MHVVHIDRHESRAVQLADLVLRAIDEAQAAVERWLADDDDHRVNLMVAGPGGQPTIHVFTGDARKTHAPGKG